MELIEEILTRFGRNRLFNAWLLLLLIVGLVMPQQVLAAPNGRAKLQDLPTQTGCTPQPANLVTWLRAEGDATDWMGVSTGQSTPGLSYASGVVGQAFRFTGGTNYASITGNASISMRNNLTVVTWFKVHSLASGENAKIFTKRVDSSFGPYELNLHNNGGEIKISPMLSTTGSSWISGPASQALSLDTWYQAVIVIDENNLHTFYLDGQSQGDVQLSAPVMDHTNSTLYLGLNNTMEFALDGAVDEFQMYNRALSAAEVQRLYNAGDAGVCLGPNHAPIAVADDSYSTDYGVALDVAAPGVLSNDIDEDGNPMTAVKVSDPANGVLALNADGSFTYTPDEGFSGDDSFSYLATDSVADSDPVIVTVTVRPLINDSALLGYWKFDDGSGVSAVDSSGTTPPNNGVLSGSAVFSANAAPITRYANPSALSLSSSTGVVMVPNSTINQLTNNFTVMGWINPSSIGSIQRMVATARTNSGWQGWGFGLNSSWLYFTNYAKGSYLTPKSTGLSAGKWHHIAVTLDSANTLTFYIDGITVGVVENAGPITPDPDDALLIGAETITGGAAMAYQFNGGLDDVRIYNQALSAAQIAELVGVDHCSEFILRSRFMVGEINRTISLENGCTYGLSTVGDAANGGSGLKISYATALEGNGAVIERDATAPQFRVMTISPAITINDLTVRGGSLAGNGGGVLAFKDLTLNHVRFENNATARPVGAAYVQTAGAVYAIGNLTVDRSTFLGNQTDGYGGAIYFTGPVGVITNSVFADNSSGAHAAVIDASSASGSLTLTNNTFTGAYKSDREAILINGAATLTNNIFDNFMSSLTASGASAMVTEDYNLFSAIDLGPQAVNDAVIHSGDHDRIAASPRFVDPANFNYRLQQSSPAIDLGTDAGLSVDADGAPRPATSTGLADIGAYEYQGIGLPSLSITKAGPPYVAAGKNMFILLVINESTVPLTDLRIVDPLPAGATYVNDSASKNGVFADGKLTWDLDPLAPNEMVRVWYQVTATQDLVSSGYTVSSVSNPAVTASGEMFTTAYLSNVTAFGFFPNPDGFSFSNYTERLDSDTNVEDMVAIFGEGVCKTKNPCVLTATAEAYRQYLTTGSGGHCYGMAFSSVLVYDRSDIAASDFQADALVTYDLTKENARKLIQKYYWNQLWTPVNASSLPAKLVAQGAVNVVNSLLVNFADPNAGDRYELGLAKMDNTGGHAVTPYAVRKIDDDTYWIYVYDNNYPNNFDRVFKVTMSTNSWVYEGGATAPGAPVSAYSGDDTVPTHLSLRSLRYEESYQRVCTTACAPDMFGKSTPANGASDQGSSVTISWEASAGASQYHYCYDTTNDNACSPWYVASGVSRTLTNLAPNTTYYWHVRAYNGGYTYSDSASTAYWSFTTGPIGSTAMTAVPSVENDAIPAAGSYDFQLDGEGYLMITRNDGLRAGVDTSGQFIAEIPGAEQIQLASGDGLNVPNLIRIPHLSGMTYTLQVTDRPNAYGNLSATANVNIFGGAYFTRLTGLKLDSPVEVLVDSEEQVTSATAEPGSNDVVGILFDPDNHSAAFTSSALDSDTPSLSMAVSQNGAPDYTFTVSGAEIPSGRTLTTSIDPTTGKLVITNDDPSSNSFDVSIERINLDGSKTTYSGVISEETDSTSLDLGSSWMGGQPDINNQPPVAQAQSLTTNQNAAVAITLVATDADLDGLAYSIMDAPSHGVLLGTAPDLIYQPNAGFSGADSFTFKASDGKVDSNVATVSITVRYAVFLPVIYSEQDSASIGSNGYLASPMMRK